MKGTLHGDIHLEKQIILNEESMLDSAKKQQKKVAL